MSTIVTKTPEEKPRAWFFRNFREDIIRHLRNLVAGKNSKDSKEILDVYFMCLPVMVEDDHKQASIFDQVRSLEATAPLLKSGTPAMRRQYEEESFLLFSTLRKLAH